MGVDSSTQSTKAVLVDATDGTVVEQHAAPHPDGTEVDPRAWLAAYDVASADLRGQAAALAPGAHVTLHTAPDATDWSVALG